MSNPDPAVDRLVQALNRLTLAIEGKNGGKTGAEWELIAEEEEASEPTSGTAGGSGQNSHIAFGDYNSFAERLPDCPGRLLGLCAKLRGGSYSSDYRARRAWESGYWASLVRAGRLEKPRQSLPIDLRPTVYIILAAPGLSEPTRVGSASDLYRITGRLSDTALCHGFPSLAEAEVYCAEAGVPLPAPHQWQ